MNIYTDLDNQKIIDGLIHKINTYKGNPVSIMEVCGSHTDAIGKYSIREILPNNVRLVSGPGCPVCVTDTDYIDRAVLLSKKNNIILCSFGDLIKVRGSEEKLTAGNNVRIVLSPFECIEIARQHPEKEIVFLSIGFETTTPITALTVIKAKQMNIKNLSFFVSNKTMPDILKYLMNLKTDVQAFLFPGNVSVIEGCEFYRNFCNQYNIKGAITGFEPIDILSAIVFILYKTDLFVNLYKRFVTEKGNENSKTLVREIFSPCDTFLREIGVVKNAGLKLNEKYADLDANIRFDLNYNIPDIKKHKTCLCGEIMLGRKTPADCPLFGKNCTPLNAVGPCMVSEEGSCAAWYKYR